MAQKLKLARQEEISCLNSLGILCKKVTKLLKNLLQYRIPYPIPKAKPGGGPATPAPSVPSTPEPPLSIADEADMKQTGRLKRYLTEQV